MERANTCPRCGHPAPAGARFCGECGMELKDGLRESGLGTLALTMGVLAMLYTFWSLFAVAVLTAALALCAVAVAFTAINIGWFWEHL